MATDGKAQLLINQPKFEVAAYATNPHDDTFWT